MAGIPSACRCPWHRAYDGSGADQGSGGDETPTGNRCENGKRGYPVVGLPDPALDRGIPRVKWLLRVGELEIGPFLYPQVAARPCPDLIACDAAVRSPCARPVRHRPVSDV
ncbi:MAG: hypothetical protein OXC68_10820 [Aestuariivita sp.]|nr:hypothetical protein [Aestuariivita sp.]